MMSSVLHYLMWERASVSPRVQEAAHQQVCNTSIQHVDISVYTTQLTPAFHSVVAELPLVVTAGSNRSTPSLRKQEILMTDLVHLYFRCNLLCPYQLFSNRFVNISDENFWIWLLAAAVSPQVAIWHLLKNTENQTYCQPGNVCTQYWIRQEFVILWRFVYVRPQRGRTNFFSSGKEKVLTQNPTELR